MPREIWQVGVKGGQSELKIAADLPHGGFEGSKRAVSKFEGGRFRGAPRPWRDRFGGAPTLRTIPSPVSQLLAVTSTARSSQPEVVSHTSPYCDSPSQISWHESCPGRLWFWWVSLQRAIDLIRRSSEESPTEQTPAVVTSGIGSE